MLISNSQTLEYWCLAGTVHLKDLRRCWEDGLLARNKTNPIHVCFGCKADSRTIIRTRVPQIKAPNDGHRIGEYSWPESMRFASIKANAQIRDGAILRLKIPNVIEPMHVTIRSRDTVVSESKPLQNVQSIPILKKQCRISLQLCWLLSSLILKMFIYTYTKSKIG